MYYYALDMIEVEVRAKVENFDDIRKNLEELGAKQVNKIHQVDRTFGHSMFLDESHQIFEGGFSARVRQVDDKTKIDWKEIRREKKHGMQLSAPVTNIEMGVEFLQKMGWEEAFVVDKVRELHEFENFKICLDEIKRLGTFIEVEITVPTEETADEALEKCKEFLAKIAPSAEIMYKYYGDLIYELTQKEK
jgi:adenylate cyclase, class 2